MIESHHRDITLQASDRLSVVNGVLYVNDIEIVRLTLEKLMLLSINYHVTVPWEGGKLMFTTCPESRKQIATICRT